MSISNQNSRARGRHAKPATRRGRRASARRTSAIIATSCVALASGVVLWAPAFGAPTPLQCSDFNGSGYTATTAGVGACEIQFTYAGSGTSTSFTMTGLTGISSLDMVVVGGGGGGGYGNNNSSPTRFGSGGGGGGGAVTSSAVATGNGTQVVVVVGAGGVVTPCCLIKDGTDSTATIDTTPTATVLSARRGDGGVNLTTSVGTQSGGSSGSPFYGGDVYTPPNFSAGGGGGSQFGGGGAGANAVGTSATSAGPGAGGAGTTVLAFGLFTSALGPYAGGGGGGSVSGTGAAGGAGGGGAGANGTSSSTAGASATGYGAGGGGASPDGAGGTGIGNRGVGGAGSAGIVLMRFLLPYVVEYDINGADGGTAPTAGRAAPGATFTASANSGSLTKAGFTFSGWNTAANGSGTSFPASVSASSPTTDVTLFATWSASGGGGGGTSGGGTSGGGGGGSAPEPSPSASATASASATPMAIAAPTVEPSAPSRLDPVGQQENTNIPVGGLQAASSMLLVNGQPMPMTVTPNAKTDPVALVFTAPGLNMWLEGRGDVNDPLGLTSKQALILQSQTLVSQRSATLAPLSLRAKVQPVARTRGYGFAPASPVKLYLLPSTYLGEVMTDANGSFAGAVPIPAGIAPGVHTLQANGFIPDFTVRSLSIGVLVKPTTQALATAWTSTKVFFEPLSADLTGDSEAALRALVKKTGKNPVRTVSIGFVQPTATTDNDSSLSLLRAKNVAAFMRSIGVKGVFVARGNGAPNEAGAAARRVKVTIAYRG
ncbi:MAG: InlB B-repeat-containing protein [Actinobacteria bacterium]|nr:InlB B-repeat-containing protein [Actinomycetota bacterium]